MRLFKASTTNKSVPATAPAVGPSKVGTSDPATTACGLPAFTEVLVKVVRLDPCPSTATATGGGLDSVVSPWAIVQSELLNGSKISSRLLPVSKTAGPSLIMTMPCGLLNVHWRAVVRQGLPVGAELTTPAKRMAAI